jgi:hypothetical protein
MAALTDPTSLPGCIVWLDAQDTSTLFQTSAGSGSVTSTGDSVGLWQDKAVSGGINRDFSNAVAGDRPIYISNSFHNKPAVRFSKDISSSCGLFSTFTQTYSSASIFVVAAPTSSSNSRVIYSHIDSLNSTTEWLYPLIQYNNTFASYYNGGWLTTSKIFELSGFDVSYSTIDEQNYNQLGFRGRTNNSRGRMLSDSPITKHALGNRADSQNAANAFDGDISEVIIYKKALSPQEHIEVQRYLAKKWNCSVPVAVATSSGNWSNPSIWLDGILPLSSDNVYANNHTVIIDQNIRANSIRNVNQYGTSFGGSFVLKNNYQINTIQTDPNNFTSGIIGNCKNVCLYNNVNLGSVVLSGDILSFFQFNNNGYDAYVASVDWAGSSDFTVFGNVAGGYYKTDGITCRSNGNLTINGNVVATANTSQGPGIRIKSGITGQTIINGDVYHETDRSSTSCIYNESDTYKIIVNGDVYGGSRNSGFGIHNKKPGTIIVYGDVYGHLPTLTSLFNNFGYGIYNEDAGNVSINGSVFAVQYSKALVSANMRAVNIFNGDVVNAPSPTVSQGTTAAIKARKYKITQECPSTTFYDVTGGYHNYRGPKYYTAVTLPPVSSVNAECLYAVFSSGPNLPERKGTMKIPVKEVVMAGETVGTESGTAVLSADSLKEVWNYKTYDVDISDSIGSRIKNSLIIEDLGKAIAKTNI